MIILLVKNVVISGCQEQKCLLHVLIVIQENGRRKEKVKKKSNPENPSWIDELIKLEEEGKTPLCKRQDAEDNTDI